MMAAKFPNHDKESDLKVHLVELMKIKEKEDFEAAMRLCEQSEQMINALWEEIKDDSNPNILSEIKIKRYLDINEFR